MPKSYPFSAWVLTRDFEPKKVELVTAGNFGGYHATSTGKYYADPQLYVSKRSALDAGWRLIDRQQAPRDRSAERMAKRKLTLTEYSKDL